jgi:hypothetical protein
MSLKPEGQLAAKLNRVLVATEPLVKNFNAAFQKEGEDATTKRMGERGAGEETPRTGYLHLNGWAGHRTHQVEVIGETPKRYRIRAITKTKLAGRCRWLQEGEMALVPKHAITF